jgi:hypothetical protein
VPAIARVFAFGEGTMATYLTELLNRVVALQKEAMTSIGISADAVPYFWHAQESFPYFTNRIADLSVSGDGSEDIDFNQPTVIMRLVVAHISEGYRGQAEQKLYEYLPVVKTYIQQRSNWLQTDAGLYVTRMDGLQSARITNGGGLRILENTGVGNVTQVCGELQLACIFDEVIEQEHY